ncbi:hypothetical protein JMA_29770 [Jeotgalibacillus malaysiensis]|uniref:Uncharacterized protein n=1 Tax=Jeotgalibacillus malaysiensis TaxID=1508404 RepID=A0A0B5AW98_9BACL|nr:hypothetical protein [Jeotgalibacillus malaysiensis]AJD92294.1 hypothetical protein JMA_29770 [Jeotgalibacillus malaysiensis]
MKLHHVATGLIAILLISYIGLKVFTDMFQTSFNESFLIELIMIFGMIGFATFLSWKAQEKEHY